MNMNEGSDFNAYLSGDISSILHQPNLIATSNINSKIHIWSCSLDLPLNVFNYWPLMVGSAAVAFDKHVTHYASHSHGIWGTSWVAMGIFGGGAETQDEKLGSRPQAQHNDYNLKRILLVQWATPTGN